MKVTLLGAGAWGTAMAAQAARHLPDAQVCLWSRSPEQIKAIQKNGENTSYLPGTMLPKKHPATPVKSDKTPTNPSEQTF